MGSGLSRDDRGGVVGGCGITEAPVADSVRAVGSGKPRKRYNTAVSGIPRGIPCKGLLLEDGASSRLVSALPENKQEAEERKKNGRLLGSMLDVYIRGRERGEEVPRAAKLVETLFDIATRSEDDGKRLAAINVIFDRIDGKVVERKEVKSMHIDGIVYLPGVEKVLETE